jgi:probable F420-dependent oxidoreductase
MAKKGYEKLRIGVFHILPDRDTGDPAVVAKRAEELGFDSYWVPEHTVIPEGSCDDYPGNPPDGPPPSYLYRMPDPFLALSRAAAVTSRIRLGTGVSLIPERNPLLTAKEIATLDHYSRGRFLFGIGAGWNEPECTVMGGDFAHRWRQTTEAIEVMKKLWSGEYVEHHGEYYDFPRVICLPKPHQSPCPPVLLGSIGSPLVYKRVAAWGDGWMPVLTKLDEMRDGRADIVERARANGRDPSKLMFVLFGMDGMWRTAEELAAVAAAGADEVVIWVKGKGEAAVLAELEALAAALM